MSGKDFLEQLDRHLASASLSWLLGAGISCGANIPLMYPLTTRVMSLVSATPHAGLLDDVGKELPDGWHIEHLLSHLGDYAAIAERSKAKAVTVGDRVVNHADIESAHEMVVGYISNTVRWGYTPAKGSKPEKIGIYGASMVAVDGHRTFVEALFKTAQAGLQERRRAVRLFTTNYDTLLEDALALACVPYWDGFSGGAVAFRTHRFGQDEPDVGYRAHLVKLHGSIDWHLCADGKVWRIRDGDNYPVSRGRVLIHPQSTKYIATQRDPFASQFDLFRRALSVPSDNVLAVCGYSFGDDHINQEIELAMEGPESRTTLVVFCMEGSKMADCLSVWRYGPWGDRVYVATEKGLYVGAEGPFHEPTAGGERDWWTFEGMTKLLRDGAEACA